jgi:hypothetical protein
MPCHIHPSLSLKSLQIRKTTTSSTSSSNSSSTTKLEAPLPSPMVRVVIDSYDTHKWDHSSVALTAWLNGRWKKTGYEMSPETVHAVLVLNGRKVELGKPDQMDGVFCR